MAADKIGILNVKKLQVTNFFILFRYIFMILIIYLVYLVLLCPVLDSIWWFYIGFSVNDSTEAVHTGDVGFNLIQSTFFLSIIIFNVH